MTLLLRCLRCGAWMSPAEAFCEERCGECESKLTRALVWRGPGAMWRMVARYRKNVGRHPTSKALAAAIDAMENTPHGTLAEQGDER